MPEVEPTGQRGRAATGSGRRSASEALARWLHHRRGHILASLRDTPPMVPIIKLALLQICRSFLLVWKRAECGESN